MKRITQESWKTIIPLKSWINSMLIYTLFASQARIECNLLYPVQVELRLPISFDLPQMPCVALTLTHTMPFGRCAASVQNSI